MDDATFKKFLAEMTPEQRKAVLKHDGVTVVRSVPMRSDSYASVVSDSGSAGVGTRPSDLRG